MSQQAYYSYGNIKLGFGNFILPPILIGTMFYQGQSIIGKKDFTVFNKEKAKKRIDLHKSLAVQYKLPEMIEISAISPEAMVKYLEFYLDNYEPPFVLGGTFEARIAGVKYLSDNGVSPENYIYNAISNLKNEKELGIIKKHKITSVVVLILGSASMSSTQRYSYITENNQPGRTNIIDGLKNCGVTRIWIDGGVIDIESLAHIIETQQIISNSLKNPVGTAPTLFLFKYSSPRLNERYHTKYRKASIIFIASWFSNFMFYGAIEDAKACFSSTFQAYEFKQMIKIHNIKLFNELKQEKLY